MRRRVEPSSPPPASSCGLGDLVRSGLLHGAHVEIEHALALVALFLVLFSELDDLFQNRYVESVAFGLRKHLPSFARSTRAFRCPDFRSVRRTREFCRREWRRQT